VAKWPRSPAPRRNFRNVHILFQQKPRSSDRSKVIRYQPSGLRGRPVLQRSPTTTDSQMTCKMDERVSRERPRRSQQKKGQHRYPPFPCFPCFRGLPVRLELHHHNFRRFHSTALASPAVRPWRELILTEPILAWVHMPARRLMHHLFIS
jgi:hypothetical protein